MIVVSMEEAVFLISMDEVVGGIEIEDELLGRGWVGESIGFDELLDEDRGEVEEGFSRNAIFESAQGGG